MLYIINLKFNRRSYCAIWCFTSSNRLSLSGNHHRIVNDLAHIADLNGYSSSNFGGSSDYLKLNSAAFNDLSDGTNYTIFILVNLLVSIFQV